MSINVNISISLEEGQTYSALEAGVIAALSGNAPAAAAAASVPAAAKAAPAPAAAAKPATRRPAAAKAKAPEPVEEAADEDEGPAAALEEDDADEDLLGAAPAKAKAATLEEAVAAATDLVSNGEQARVKEALSSLGAKRVSELKGAKIGQFLAALED